MINAIEKELVQSEISRDAYTENGARVHVSTGRALLDMNFKVASYRGASQQTIIQDFTKAYSENAELAVKWLFFVRDVREGLGERDLFRTILQRLITLDVRVKPLLKLVPEYGRWDDLLIAFDSAQEEVVAILSKQLNDDVIAMKAGKPASLCAKWMPSVNTSSAGVRKMARKLAMALSMKERDYRKMLSSLRAYLDVIEVKAAAKKWGAINYEHVPSMANLKYRNAFLKNDEERRREYLGKLEKGEAKINASVAFPHDIVHQYGCKMDPWSRKITHNKVDPAIEAMWKALPEYGLRDTLVVADGSGSMMTTIPGTSAQALEIANALAIYCAEHNVGDFKDKYITFSERPQMINFSSAQSLLGKMLIALEHNEVANTNIQAVFELILRTAAKAKMTQEEMIKNVLIISDMEFDACTGRTDVKLFQHIANEYANLGYKLPRLIFWNVNSRTGAIPVVENECGVALVSGFSINLIKMVMSGTLDPYQALLEILNSERYKPIVLI